MFIDKFSSFSVHRYKDTSFHLQNGCSPMTWFNQWNVNENVTMLLPTFSERAPGFKEVCIDVEVNCSIFPYKRASLDRQLNAQSPWTPSMNKGINYCFMSHHSFEGGLFLCTGKCLKCITFLQQFPELSSSYLQSFFKKGWLMTHLCVNPFKLNRSNCSFSSIFHCTKRAGS